LNGVDKINNKVTNIDKAPVLDSGLGYLLFINIVDERIIEAFDAGPLIIDCINNND